jgi:hypothetical protein
MKKNLAVAFNSTFEYINDVSSISNNQFHKYVDSIYPNEFEMIYTTECSTCDWYLGILLELYTNGNMRLNF